MQKLFVVNEHGAVVERNGAPLAFELSERPIADAECDLLTAQFAPGNVPMLPGQGARPSFAVVLRDV